MWIRRWVMPQEVLAWRWVHQNELRHARSSAGLGRPVQDSVTLQSTLRDTLEAMVTEGGRAIVTGSRGSSPAR